MKAVKLFISNPQVPITILMMLALMFILIAKLSAKGRWNSNRLNTPNIEEVKNEINTAGLNVSKEYRSIKLYPIYN